MKKIIDCNNIDIKNIDQRCTLKKYIRWKVDFFLMKKGIHIMNPKKQKSICHRTTFYP